LSGHAWRSQQQWSAREQYYGKLLTHLHDFKMRLDDLSDYYVEPGSEHMPDNQRGENFHKLLAEASSAYTEVRRQLGPAAIYLSPQSVKSLEKMFATHWGLAFDAMCTADYVDGANKLATATYRSVLREARAHLGIGDE
jgi:hypothetical protein